MRSTNEWRRFYESLGLVAIPLRPREKRPLRKGWTSGDVGQWEKAPAEANVGILTGVISRNLVVLDFDTGDGPFEVLGLRPRELASRTIVVKTARGWHVYARSSDTGTTSPRSGLDVRGDGALVAAPPSIHPSGKVYELVGPARTIADLSSFSTPDMLSPATAAGPLVVGGVDMAHLEEWISAQWPALQAAWAKLHRPPDGASFDPSRADFAVARCLWEGGYSAEQVADILCALPGSRARERGRPYAMRTAIKARGQFQERRS
ncbi:MAG: bifunctional DNA primase/polymerase [Candidatus Thermoplasmatota archaeon]